MKAVTYRTPNRIEVNTGHKAFDRRADYIGTGNVLSNIQTSSFIRAATDTECNGRHYAPGKLRQFDVDHYARNAPAHVRRALLRLTESDTVIFYCFHSTTGGKRTVHGYAITSRDYTLLADYVTGPTGKSAAVMEWCLAHVCNDPFATSPPRSLRTPEPLNL